MYRYNSFKRRNFALEIKVTAFLYPLDVHNGIINKLKLTIMLTSFFMGLLKALAVTTVAYTGKELLNPSLTPSN